MTTYTVRYYCHNCEWKGDLTFHAGAPASEPSKCPRCDVLDAWKYILQ